MTQPADRITDPIPVEIKNWAPTVKPRFVRSTSLKCYTIDPASADNPGGRRVQIAALEPNRVRLAVQVVDASVALLVDSVPTASPDASTVTSAPASGGIPLLPNLDGAWYEFFGPDAFWINSLAAATRVNVVKEYC